MTREEINKICHIVHSTILSFFEPLSEEEERPFTKEELLLLRVNKAICKEIEKMCADTYCSCKNCKNDDSVYCEPHNKKEYGYCGNWERRRKEEEGDENGFISDHL